MFMGTTNEAVVKREPEYLDAKGSRDTRSEPSWGLDTGGVC